MRFKAYLCTSGDEQTIVTAWCKQGARAKFAVLAGVPVESVTAVRALSPKVRTYKTRASAERRLAVVQAMHPDRKFWVLPAQNFRFAVYTTGEFGRIAIVS